MIERRRIHRRMMAYACLAGMFAIVYRAFGAEIPASNAQIMMAALPWLAGVVAWYMGVQVAPELVNRGGPPA